LHYQPIVAAATGEVVAAEALARIPGVAGVALSAKALFTRASGTAAAIALDRLVVTQASAAAERWRSLGLRIPIHVNISASTLEPRSLRDFRRWIARVCVDPALLAMEITEAEQIADVDEVAAFVDECRMRGIDVALDDFGCGSSTLAIMQSLRANILKIDRRFVTPLCRDVRTAAIVRHIIDLAHELDMAVIAEGVETVEAAAWLERAGCDYFQGYLVAHPMPHDEFAAWCEGRRRGGSPDVGAPVTAPS
jgi:EAL domain-containing protein (putative c-di-GMP-specific phosphodiesterase class I)